MITYEDFERATLFFDAKDYAGAARLLAPVVAEEPGNRAAVELLARAYFHSAQLGRAEETFREYLDRRVTRPRFAHGRSVRNAIDRARLRQANRLFAEAHGELSREELMTITPDDILQSSVFAEDREPGDELPARGAV